MRSIGWHSSGLNGASSMCITRRRWSPRHWPRRDPPRIEISHEPELLDPGGGVARALPLLDDVFFVVNSDVFWLDGKDRALQRLAAAFDPERMDAILLLQRP